MKAPTPLLPTAPSQRRAASEPGLQLPVSIRRDAAPPGTPPPLSRHYMAGPTPSPPAPWEATAELLLAAGSVDADRSFYELVSELIAQYDRVQADQKYLEAQNGHLLHEVTLLRGGDKVTHYDHHSGLNGATNDNTKYDHEVAMLRGGAKVTHYDHHNGHNGGTNGNTKFDPEVRLYIDTEPHLRVKVVSPRVAAGGLLPEPTKPANPGWPRPEDNEERVTPGWGIGPPSPSSLAKRGVSVEPLVRRRQDQKLSVLGQQAGVLSDVFEYEVQAALATEEDFGRPGKMSQKSSASEASRFAMDSEWTLGDDVCAKGETELQMLPVWTRSEEDAQTSPSERRRASSIDDVQSDDDDKAHWFQRYIILTPAGRTAFAWDFFTFVILLYDMVVIPLQAYPLPDWEIWYQMELFATVAWTVDFTLCFIRGYEEKGNIELRPGFILRHYMRTWFIFDFSIVAMDWVTFFLYQSDVVDLLRFGRVRRGLRLLRLARLIKHGQRFFAVINFIRSESWVVGFRIFGLLVALVALNHFISCGWYAIGTLDGMGENSWTKKAFIEEEHGFGYRYVTSFHWSVTQFTPASMEVVPKNVYERVFNIIMIFFGLIMFSIFISSMTNSMIYLTKINYEKRQHQNLARNYICGKGVPLELANDIMRHVAVTQNLRRGLREADVGAFETIPKRLLESMRLEVHRPVLCAHALFGYLFRADRDTFVRVCNKAVTELAMVSGEELFAQGNPAKHMYFVSSGVLSCTLPSYGEVETKPADVGVKQWLCEGALWVVWEHRGRCTASSSSCDVTELNAEEFHRVISRTTAWKDVQKYALAWAKAAAAESGGAELVADSWGQRLQVSELVQKTLNVGEERVFQAWVKYALGSQEKKREKNEAAKIERRRRRGSSNGKTESKEEREERRQKRREDKKNKRMEGPTSPSGTSGDESPASP